MHLTHNFDRRPLAGEGKRDGIYYTPTSPSEHHPLPTTHDWIIEERSHEEPLNPLHPFMRTKLSHTLNLPDKPVKKFVDYYGVNYL